MSLTEEKQSLRARAMAARRVAHEAAGPDAAEALWRNLRRPLAGSPGDAAVSGFWPIGDEIDIRPVLERLHAAGRTLCLPVVPGPGRELLFRRWRPGDPLADGPMGTRQPLESAEKIVPGVLLVPLLAYDSGGRRLGYGGGYYDRTLRALRSRGPVVAIGVAYAAQRVDAVPAGPKDEPLDWVATESAALRVGESVP